MGEELLRSLPLVLRTVPVSTVCLHHFYLFNHSRQLGSTKNTYAFCHLLEKQVEMRGAHLQKLAPGGGSSDQHWWEGLPKNLQRQDKSLLVLSGPLLTEVSTSVGREFR